MLATITLFCGLTFAAQAATLTVTKIADTNDGACTAADCSLREAITAAAAGDTIAFASPLFDSPQTITLSDASGFQQLTINKNLTITGRGATLLTIARASNATAQFRIFNITGGAIVNLSGMTISGGNVNGDGGGISNVSSTLTLTAVHVTSNSATNFGGGVFNTGGTLNVIRSTISNNTATSPFGTGGGIDSGDGNLNVTNSTISGNSAPSADVNGGGIFAGNTPTINVTISNSTITDNLAAGANSASGVLSNNATVTVRSSIIAANRNNSTIPDVRNSFISQGYNLIGNSNAATGFTAATDKTGTATTPLNPQLAALGFYGGTTPTHALQGSSPAIDAGNSFGLTTDQRGVPRPFDNPNIANATGGDGADIGAFEVQATTADDIIIEGIVRNAAGAPVRGARLTLGGSAQAVMFTDEDGRYSFTVMTGGVYQVSVAARGQRFAPAQLTFGSLVANQVADFNATSVKGRSPSRSRF